jgi:uncharacterized membrane protein (UPF0127 family)
VLAVAAFVGFLLVGANRPRDPLLVPAARTPISGFGEIAYRIDPGPAGGGVAAQRCALLADTAEQQELGLMHRTDLAGHDGMLFRFPSDTTIEFYMKDTLLPLSIAWFDSHGSFVSATDMDPCPSQLHCPTFASVAPYRYALEVLRGQLAGQGIGPGSHLVVGGACR